MKPLISVVAAVRRRIDPLRLMLDSLLATAGNPDGVEVVLRCDFDDFGMLGFLGGLARHHFIVGPRFAQRHPHLEGYAALPALANEAARLSHADLVLVVNDDVEFITPGWDTRLVDIAAQYPDGIFDIGVETENAKNFVFPCVSRRQIELLGGVVEERLVYPDIWLRDVMQPFGRAIRARDVRIAHHWRGMSPDQERAVAAANTEAHRALYTLCVNEGRAKIEAAMSEELCGECGALSCDCGRYEREG